MNFYRWIAIATVVTVAASAMAAEPPASQQLAAHVLNRIAYGPKPGDIERVAQMGVQRYIDSQLQPEAIPLPPQLNERLRALEAAQAPAGETLGRFLAVR